jgi:hypothetical protein
MVVAAERVGGLVPPSVSSADRYTGLGPFALGHKRIFCDARAMSALPPIADMKWQFATAEPECALEPKMSALPLKADIE